MQLTRPLNSYTDIEMHDDDDEELIGRYSVGSVLALLAGH